MRNSLSERSTSGALAAWIAAFCAAPAMGQGTMNTVRVSETAANGPIVYDTACCTLPAGGPGNKVQEQYKGAIHPSMNDSGQLFTFSTNACNVTPAVQAAAMAPGATRVHHHYAKAAVGPILVLTADSAGNLAQDGYGVTSTIAPDGRAAVFEHTSASLAGLPVECDHANQRNRIYLKSFTGALTEITPDSAVGPLGSSRTPRIGGPAPNYRICFLSDAIGSAPMSPAPTEVYVTTSLSPVAWTQVSAGGGGGALKRPEISSDGNVIVWQRGTDLWMSMSTSPTTWSLPVAVVQGYEFRGVHSLSATGAWLAFDGRLANTTDKFQVYRVDLTQGSPTPMLISANGATPGDGDSTYPRISDDGTCIAYISTSTNLDPTTADEEPGNLADVFLYNAGTTSLLTPNTTGLCALPDIAGDPLTTLWVVFSSNSCDAEFGLDPSDDNCPNCATTYKCSPCATFSGSVTGSLIEPCHDLFRVEINPGS
ncbi:MAG: hypothetical protein AAF628_15890 [Planctomycetota bacterium]